LPGGTIHVVYFVKIRTNVGHALDECEEGLARVNNDSDRTDVGHVPDNCNEGLARVTAVKARRLQYACCTGRYGEIIASCTSMRINK
jgi:hypothetical protein